MGTQTFRVRDASRMAAVREELAERLWIYHILPVLTHTQPSPIKTTTKTSVSPPTAKTLTPASSVLTAVLKQELDLDDVTGI